MPKRGNGELDELDVRDRIRVQRLIPHSLAPQRLKPPLSVWDCVLDHPRSRSVVNKVVTTLDPS